MLTRYFLLVFIMLMLASCSKSKPQTKTTVSKTLSKTGIIGWEKVGEIPQIDSLPKVATDFILADEKPVIAIRQHLEYKGGGEYKKTKEFKVLKFEGEAWETIRYQKSYAQNWFRNLAFHDNSLFMIYNWLTIQNLQEGEWKEFTGGQQFSPSKVKGYQSYPYFSFTSSGKPIALWNDDSYIAEGYTKGGKWLSASHFVNGKWEWLGKRAFGKDTGSPILRLSNDKPWVLFKDYGEEVYKDGRSILSMMAYENGKWVFKGKRGFNPGSRSGTSFDFEVYNNIPYAAFTYEETWTGHYSQRTTRVVVMKFENDTWSAVGDLQTTGYVRDPQIEINSRGELFVAYVDNFKQIRVRKFENGNWVDLGQIGHQPYGKPLTVGQRVRTYQFHNMYFDLSNSGQPFVSFIQKAYVLTQGIKGDRTYDELYVYKYTAD